MDMSDEGIKMVAGHMGHSTAIHTDVYRVQQNLISRSKMASILLKGDRGFADMPTLAGMWFSLHTHYLYWHI